jgi:hypothetical protein
MASELHMKFSLTAREEINAGSSQIHSVIDSVAQRRWGGKIDKTYTSAVDSDDSEGKIIAYNSAVVKYASLNSGGAGNTDLSGATWLDSSHANYSTVGSIPGNTTGYGFAIECIELVGTATSAKVYFGEQHLCALAIEEGFVLPGSAFDIRDIDIISNVADYPDNYALVNVLLGGM